MVEGDFIFFLSRLCQPARISLRAKADSQDGHYWVRVGPSPTISPSKKSAHPTQERIYETASELNFASVVEYQASNFLRDSS